MINTVFKVTPTGTTVLREKVTFDVTQLDTPSLEYALAQAQNVAKTSDVDVVVYPFEDRWFVATIKPEGEFEPGDRVRHTAVPSRPTGTVVKGTPHASGQIWVHWDQDEGRSAVGGQIVRALPENLELLED